MAHFIILIALILSQLASVTPEQGSFTSYVNMEKLYTLEDELISVSDLVLNQERTLHGDEDPHGIYNTASIAEKVKDIHRLLISNTNFTSYLVHPINIYHMTKRLANEWNKVISTLENSKSCAKAMRLKIENIADNLPSEKHLRRVCRSIINLVDLYNISVEDVMSGTISGVQALSSLSLDDAFEFARVAYEMKKFKQVVDWLNVVTSRFKQELTSFQLTSAMNLLSSAYLKLQSTDKALSTLEATLKIEPNNVVAQRNRQYVLTVIREGGTKPDSQKAEETSQKQLLVRSYCSSEEKVVVKRGSRGYCTYMASRRQGWFERPKIKAEVYSTSPLILLLRDFTNTSQQKAVARIGHNQMRDILSKDYYTHPDGLSGLAVVDNTYWQWIPEIQRRLEDIKLTDSSPSSANFLVRNVGMEGLKMSNLYPAAYRRLGTFILFLSEPTHGGGGVVFPFAKTKVPAENGSVLFYESKLQNQVSLCPLLVDTQWIGVCPLDDEFNYVCHKESFLIPKR